MKFHVRYDIHQVCRMVLIEQLDKSGILYSINNFGEIIIKDPLNSKLEATLADSLLKYGIEILADPKTILVQQIKDIITELLYSEELPSIKVSSYIAKKLNHSYGYLSNLFSSVTHGTIENFLIFRRIEIAKELIIGNDLTLTEISYRLNYNSVAHLSSQFKKITGLSPTIFQKIVNQRKLNEQMALAG